MQDVEQYSQKRSTCISGDETNIPMCNVHPIAVSQMHDIITSLVNDQFLTAEEVGEWCRQAESIIKEG